MYHPDLPVKYMPEGLVVDVPSYEELHEVIDAALPLFQKDKSVVDVEPPALVIGDLHGRYDALQAMLALPDQPGCISHGVERFIFLGDYVDRGPFMIPLVYKLLRLKIESPEDVSRGEGGEGSTSQSKIYFYVDFLNTICFIYPPSQSGNNTPRMS